ncbi:MerR family transcriptional regulator [Paenibacillus sp. HWE-109]|uniref:MerR family transcriptional regulator n=1 Tax=Paenibacillus sp. HWE-109 TaxID=1306526 RepID=UPI001EDEE21C|nr:MerR family transcriptional regulator [Paenibacillus sp. HWE-109]UKS24290.1 MerR family transcriptional regulator [Paenibacillus sp. HWE-109]
MLINEISRKLGITPRAIRFYEQKGLLAPAKQKENGYRIYTDHDAWRLQTIISLREVGMTLEDIRLTLAKTDLNRQEEVLNALQLQRSMLFQQWSEMKQIIATMDQMIEAADSSDQLPTELLYELAKHNKELRELRSSWRDHWDFDHKASQFDEQLLSVPASEMKGADSTIASVNPLMTTAYDAAQTKVVELIAPYAGRKGLDIGTGTGNLAGKLQQAGLTMAAIDQSQQMLKLCAAKFADIQLKLGNVLAIPYMDAEFDVVVSSFALHHLTEPQRELAWREMLRVLKPGGIICLTDYMLEAPESEEIFLRNLISSQAAQLPMMHEQVELYMVHSELMAWLQQHATDAISQQVGQDVYVVTAQK